MITRILALVAALAVTAGVAVVAIAAPALAHHNTITVVSVECAADSTYRVTWEVTNSEAGQSEVITSSTDEWLVPSGTAIAAGESKRFVETYDIRPTAPKTLILGARWENGQSSINQGTLQPNQFPETCAPAADVWATCLFAAAHTGRMLAIGDAITVVVLVAGQQRLVTGTVAAGEGYAGLALTSDNLDPVPLSKSDVLSGYLWFAYPLALGVRTFDLMGVRSPGATIETGTRIKACGDPKPITITAVPRAEPPTCEADGFLVITPQDNITFTGGANGDGPGTYTIVATVTNPNTDEGTTFVLEGPDRWEIEVQPRRTTPDCGDTVVPVAPVVVAITACGEYGSITLAVTPGVVYELVLGDGRSGPYSVRATPADGFVFGDPDVDPQVIYFNGDLGHYRECVTPVPPSAVAETCDDVNGGTTSGSITIPATTGIVYFIDGTRVNGPTSVPTAPGRYTVTVTAEEGFEIQGDSSFTVTVEEATGCLEPVEITVRPAVEPQTCDVTTGTLLDGAVVITRTENVSFAIDGTPVATPVSENRFTFPVGTYTVTATAAAGFLLVGTSTFALTVEAYPLACNEVPKKVETEASATPAVCPSDNATEVQRAGDASANAASSSAAARVQPLPGFITVRLAEGVTYFIDGVPVTQTVTTVTPGVRVVTAVAEPGFQIDGLSEWRFTLPALTCGGLALTGAAPVGLAASAVALVVVGGVLIGLRVRRRRRRHAVAR